WAAAISAPTRAGSGASSKRCLRRPRADSGLYGDPLDEVAPEGEAQAGGGGGQHVAVLELDSLLDQVVEERVVTAGELEQVHAGGGDGQGRSEEHRSELQPHLN